MRSVLDERQHATPRRARRAAGGGANHAADRDGGEDDAAQKRTSARHLTPSSDRRRRLDAAVAALALLVVEDRLEQVPAAEVGPQRVGDPDLGVGDLPEQEVADAHLAAGADQQIGIGLAGRVEKLAEPLPRRGRRARSRSASARRAASTISARPP